MRVKDILKIDHHTNIAKPEKLPSIVIIGGGTGSFTLLQGLKTVTPNLTAIVSMSDDGGSSGVLRDELGVLPPGDVRQCLVALSDSPEIRNLFSYRFGDGRFEGQSLGNIILSGLELQYGNFAQAIKIAGHILHITGKVIPVTLEKHELVIDDGNETIHGEYIIRERIMQSTDARLRLQPPVMINPEARQAIIDADLIVIAPGHILGSIIPNLLVSGMVEALSVTSAPLVYVSNLVTKPGQTDGWHVVDFVNHLEKYLGQRKIDYVLYNTEPIKSYLLHRYAAEGELPVLNNTVRFSEIKAQPIGAHLVSQSISIQDPNDKAIKRTLIRHDAKQVAKRLFQIWYELDR
ncbi:MAG: gluconeogenesis factor YvcK family protein [Candidatus Saccharimonadales bacterium]|jgi:uncharacterized cofD-like protein